MSMHGRPVTAAPPAADGREGTYRCEYVWIGGSGELRSKTRVLAASEAPERWTFDGSSTGQAPGDDSEVELRPVASFRDPFGDAAHGDRLLLCECYTMDGRPAGWNHRAAAAAGVGPVHAAHDLWFGFELEYFLVDPTTGRPLGWPADRGAVPRAQGPFYCGVGADCAQGRAVKDAQMEACQRAGIAIAGSNGEVAPGQWVSRRRRRAAGG